MGPTTARSPPEGLFAFNPQAVRQRPSIPTTPRRPGDGDKTACSPRSPTKACPAEGHGFSACPERSHSNQFFIPLYPAFIPVTPLPCFLTDGRVYVWLPRHRHQRKGQS